MRTRLLTTAALAAAALAASTLPGSTASALSFADCPYGSVNGTATYAPPLTTSVIPNTSWTISMTMTCVGSAPAAGTYNVTLTGLSAESCTSGTGNGTITGTGPNGTLTGTTGYQRFGVHLYGFAPYATTTFTSGGESYTLAIWLDVFGDYPSRNPVCPLPTGTVVGHAAVTGP